MGALKEWAKNKSPYLKLDDNESVKCVYNGFKIVPSRFEPDQETVMYMLTVDGQDKLFESKAGSVAESFDKLIEGDGVLIGRIGLGNKTKYSVAKIGDSTETESKGTVEAPVENVEPDEVKVK